MNVIKLLLSLVIFPLYTTVYAGDPKLVDITQYGAASGSSFNTMHAVKSALYLNRREESLILRFPKGRYEFWPDSAGKNMRGFQLFKRKNLVVEGNGSEFIFHERMLPVFLDSCENIRLQDFTIDWERPFCSQAIVRESTPAYITIEVDKDAYPYVIENNRLLFVGEGWKLGVEWYNLYDKQKQEIVAGTLDKPMGNDFFTGRAEELSPGIIRVYGNPKMQPEPGTYVSLLHVRYATVGIQLNRSKDIMLSNVTIHHALSMGVVAFRTENIELRQVKVIANESKGRVFSAIADGFHFSTCGGFVKLNHCVNTGQADDFVNIHGEYFRIADRENDYTLKTAVKGRGRDVGQLIAAGEELYFIDSLTMERTAAFTVSRVEPIYSGKSVTGYRISCKQPLPAQLGNGWFAENKTWAPEVEITHCHFLKKNRARGLLITTPKKVLIENNYFNTAGAAILIEGDVNYWYESGATRNVIIRRNIFDNCYTSPWGMAAITITPSVRPQSVADIAYHSNIQITSNVFKQTGAAVLYARSVDRLQFSKNTLSFNTAMTSLKQPLLYMDGCRNAIVAGNTYTGFPKTDLHTLHMQPTDVQIKSDALIAEVK